MTPIQKDAFESGNFPSLLSNIIEVISRSPEIEIRKDAFEIIKTTYNMLDVAAKPPFFAFMESRTSELPVLRGWLVTSIKDVVIEELKSGNVRPQFRGENLKRTLRPFARLKNGVETDIVDHKEEILAIINGLACLWRFDAAKDASGIADFKLEFEEDYVRPLRKAVEISRSHYEQKLREFEADKDSEAVNAMKGAILAIDMISCSLSML